jgi:hypothetical protein
MNEGEIHEAGQPIAALGYKSEPISTKDTSMLRSVKQLYGKALGTAEGEIGHVKDFYFNDQHWVVRYVIADTGSRLSGRLVLISPHAFGDFHQS